MKHLTSVALVSLAALVASCGGGGGSSKEILSAADRSEKKDSKGKFVSKKAAASFDAALQTFADHDKKQDWSDANCTAVAKQFDDAADAQRSDAGRDLPEALYNSGLSYQRCGKDNEAKEKFEATVTADGGFHRARAQLVLYEYARNNDVDGAISKLDTIIRDAKFQNVEGLVALAALQMERGGDQPDGDGKNDLERAQRNLQRALAIDDGFMPAFNQLAVYYLEQAKAKAGAAAKRTRRGRRGLEVSGAKGVDVDGQMLDLAALVASQAQRKNPNYAPIHNTIGLIQVQLKNFNSAVKSFGRARQLDSKFFEAHMNYGAVSLSFRGFDEAEKAYRDALRLRPKEYEAHLGLALALRGQINDSNFEKMVSAAVAELEEAKKTDSSRAETYYNEAILTHEFRAKRAAGPSAIPLLEKSTTQYRDFIAKAGEAPEFAEAVKRSKERVQDIDDTVKFIKEGEVAEREAADAAKAAKAQQAAGEAPPAGGDAKPADAKGGAAKPADAKGGAAKPADAKKK